MRSYWNRDPPYSNMTGVLIKRKPCEDNQACTQGEYYGEIAGLLPQGKELAETRREGCYRSFPSNFRYLLTSWFQTSSFQNCETIHFCCLSHWVCSTLLQQAQQTNRTHLYLQTFLLLKVMLKWILMYLNGCSLFQLYYFTK